jgi:predicted transcriptional regulator
LKKGDDNAIVRLHKEGRSYRQIGDMLGISHVAVRKRYLKAIKVTGQENPTYKPEKSRVADQKSDTAENLNVLNVYGNLKKPETLTKFSQNEINKEDITPPLDGNLPGNQSTVNTEPPAEPMYFLHRPTKEIFRRNDEIDDEIRAELEPYFPPKYLRKINEPHKIFIWTLALGQKWDEFEPYHGPLPWKPKREEG